jgi:serine/threonine-protein kinase HipA
VSSEKQSAIGSRQWERAEPLSNAECPVPNAFYAENGIELSSDPMSERLIALYEGRGVGEMRRDSGGRVVFRYDEGWRNDPHGFPLSLSMPLTMERHDPAVVEAFLWNLLPDSAMVQDRWAQRFGVPRQDVLVLLAHVGSDCAGAIQFVSPERLESAGGQEPMTWLTEAEVAMRLRTLRRDSSAFRLSRDRSWLTLAGAQAKTAFFFASGRCGVPSGATPTTHIVKLPDRELDGHAENEHFCLVLAARLGLAAARSELRHFEDEVALMVERFDRQRREDGTIRRVHQEDLCQALGVMPTRKYQREGGPDASTIAGLIGKVSASPQKDEGRFGAALAFNWLIGNVDAHAKNYALTIGDGGAAALAPLYDLVSALPYESDPSRIGMAMTPAGEDRIGDLAVQIPDHANDVRRALEAEGLRHPVIGRLAALVTARAQRWRASRSTSAAT